MSGECEFVLTDREYHERSWTPERIDLPALDFRSKIPGMYVPILDNAGNPTGEYQINSVSFVPSASLAPERGAIRVNLESLNGIGM